MAERQYIGARYVPLPDGEWDATKAYEALTIVLYENNGYTSKKPVPAGIVPTNTEYWALTEKYDGKLKQLELKVDENRADLQAEIDSLKAGTEATLDTIVDEINANRQTINDHSTSINGLITKTDTLQSDLNTVTGKVTDNTNSIASVNTALGNTNENVANNASEITNLHTLVSSMSSDITLINGEINTNRGNINDLKTTTDQHTTAIGDLNTTVGQHTTAIDNLNNTVGDHTASIDSLNSTVGQHTSAINTLNTTVGENSTAITTLNTTVQNNSNAISTLNTTVTGHTTDISNQNTRITQMGAAIADTNTRLSEIGTNVANNTNNISAVQGDLNQLINDVVKNTNDIASNKEEIGANTTSITQVVSRVNKNASDISLLQKTLGKRKCVIIEDGDITPYIPTVISNLSKDNILAKSFTASSIFTDGRFYIELENQIDNTDFFSGEFEDRKTITDLYLCVGTKDAGKTWNLNGTANTINVDTRYQLPNARVTVILLGGMLVEKETLNKLILDVRNTCEVAYCDYQIGFQPLMNVANVRNNAIQSSVQLVTNLTNIIAHGTGITSAQIIYQPPNDVAITGIIQETATTNNLIVQAGFDLIKTINPPTPSFVITDPINIGKVFDDSDESYFTNYLNYYKATVPLYYQINSSATQYSAIGYIKSNDDFITLTINPGFPLQANIDTLKVNVPEIAFTIPWEALSIF